MVNFDVELKIDPMVFAGVCESASCWSPNKNVNNKIDSVKRRNRIIFYNIVDLKTQVTI